MAGSKLRVILVGAGGMGNTHIDAWRSVDHTEIVAVCDNNGPRAREFAQKHNIGQVFTGYRKALRVPADVVDVCVPNSYHTPIVLEGFRTGKHVLCEKPLSVLPRDVEKMMAARDRAKKLLMTAQHMRFSGPSQVLKRYIDGGNLGDVYYARAWHLRRRLVPTWGVFGSRKHSGGGAGVDIGVHSLDLTMWLMDNFEPVSVSGIAPCMLATRRGTYNRWGPVNPREFDVEDFAVGFARFKNGAALSLEASWMLNIQPRSIINTWLFGTKGGVQHPSLAVSTEKDQIQLDSTIINPPENVNAYHTEIQRFAEAIAKGKPSPVPAEQTLQVIKVLDGIYRSHKLGKEVKL